MLGTEASGAFSKVFPANAYRYSNRSPRQSEGESADENFISAFLFYPGDRCPRLVSRKCHFRSHLHRNPRSRKECAAKSSFGQALGGAASEFGCRGCRSDSHFIPRLSRGLG